MGGGECCEWRIQRKRSICGHADHLKHVDRMSVVLWEPEIKTTCSSASTSVDEDRTRQTPVLLVLKRYGSELHFLVYDEAQVWS
jgi:hypothetical protein